MDKPWLKQYPAGVPAEIDANQYQTVSQVLEESLLSITNQIADSYPQRIRNGLQRP